MTSPAAPPSLLYERLETPLAPLDRLPKGLWLWSLVHSHGTLVPRLAGVEAFRDSLVAGTLHQREDWTWPAPQLAARVGAAFAELDLPRYARGRPDLTESMLRSLLWHLDRICDYMDRGASPEEAETRAVDAFQADWAERCGELDELIAVFGDLGDLPKNMRWDLMHGLLTSVGWREVLRIRQLLERLPELTRLIRALGRVRVPPANPHDPMIEVPVPEQAPAPRPRLQPRRVPEVPGETRGIRRSARVSRMLPAEALLLRHPRLRLVWHARHAERTLLTYEDDDHLPERVITPEPSWQAGRRKVPGPRPELGPMLVCVDTSGSMQGGAEAVAKAAVLEAARTAHAEGRGCHVFAFSGPGEVVEMELGVDPEGVERLTRFMGQSFRGGTDIAEPIERALTRLDEAKWRMADLLIASDGEFGAPPAVAAAMRNAREKTGLRVQGILIGDRETIGFLELADSIYWVRDWRRYGSSDADSPVHSSSLTAEYFPGALRTPGAAAGTETGEEASRAIRAGRHAGAR